MVAHIYKLSMWRLRHEDCYELRTFWATETDLISYVVVWLFRSWVHFLYPKVKVNQSLWNISEPTTWPFSTPCPRLPYIYSFFHISEVQEQRILHPLEKVCIGLQFCTVFSCSFWSFILPLRNPITEPHNHSRASDSHRGLGKTKRFESGGLRCYSSKEMPAGASSAALDAALGGWGHFKPRTKGLWEHSLPSVKTSQAAEGGARVF